MNTIKKIFKKTEIPEDMLRYCEEEKIKRNQAILSILMPFIMLAMTIVSLIFAYTWFLSGFNEIKSELYVIFDVLYIFTIFICYFIFKVHKTDNIFKADVGFKTMYLATMLWALSLSALDENAGCYIIALLVFSTTFIIEKSTVFTIQGIILPISLVMFLLMRLDEALLLSIYINIIFGNIITFIVSSIGYNTNIENFVGKKIIEKQNQELREMALTDGLTGVYNRRFFDENLNKVIKTMSRSKCNITLMMIDIDFFKKFNDTYGHVKGDECLKLVAKAISMSIKREDDFVARYGGEEFAVVLPNADENAARVVAERLLMNIRRLSIPHESSVAERIVTISIGSATGDAGIHFNRLDYIKQADEMLYESKRNGRNQSNFAVVQAV